MSKNNHAQESFTQTCIKAPSAERAFLNARNELDARGVSGTDIDNVAITDYRISGGQFGPEREHLLLAISNDGIRDVIWYSPAASPEVIESPLTIITKPGLGEIVEDGIGWRFHKELANRNPGAKVLTHATEGFGPGAQHCSILELPKKSLDRMAEHGRFLMLTYFHDERIATVGTSMGTRIFHELLINNRAENRSDQLNIVANLNHAPALVDPKNIIEDMVLKFPAALLIDGTAEMFTRTSPRRLFELFVNLVESKPLPRDILPMGRAIIDLLRGVDEEDVRANALYYPTATITGTKDPVGEIPMWDRIPEVLLKKVHGRGHAIAMKPREGAIKVTRTLREMNVYSPVDDGDYQQEAA